MQDKKFHVITVSFIHVQVMKIYKTTLKKFNLILKCKRDLLKSSLTVNVNFIAVSKIFFL